MEHLMFKWYITENFSLKVLKIAFLIYECVFTVCEDNLRGSV